jgi:hypothetical protein
MPHRGFHVAALLFTAAATAGQAQTAPGGQPRNEIYRQQVRIAVGNGGTHFVTEQETFWRIGTRDTLVLLIDSTLRVVRVALDGQRTGTWGRTGVKLVIPHARSPGDTLVTRIRFHGTPNGHDWFALPRDAPDSAALALMVEVPAGSRPVTDATLEQVDTLGYGRTNWRFRVTAPIALRRLHLAVAPAMPR